MSYLSKLKRGSWSINDVYGRINFRCWGFESQGSGLHGLYVWGHNPHGEQGYSRTGTDQHIPILVGSVDCWTTVSEDIPGRYWNIAAKADGSAWAWGHNPHGQLGNGSYANKSSPTQIAGCWRTVAAGYYHAVGVKCDGTLWTWGYNGHGELGFGVAGGSCPAPVQVGACSDWLCAHAGHHQTFGIKCNNTLFSWGYNGHGDLGDGTTSNRSSPVQIAGSWTCARGFRPAIGRKTDGCMFAWGHNPHGQIGNGTATPYCSPVLLPGSWCHVTNTADKHHNVGGVKSDGTLWVWGHLNHGETGCCGCFGNILSPYQVPGTDWCWIGSGYNYFHAVKCNGTMWGWGTNPHGHIDNTGIPRCSPQQILGNNWKDVAGAHWQVVARSNGISTCQEGISMDNYPSVFYQSFCNY